MITDEPNLHTNEQSIQSDDIISFEDTNKNTEVEEVVTEEDVLEKTIRERDEFQALAQRAQADFVNYKRRMEEDRLFIGQVAISQLIIQLFLLKVICL